MPGGRFDRFARWLSTVRTRRFALTTVGGVLAAVLGGDSVAACVKIGRRCKRKNGQDRPCCNGAKCHGKRCRCPQGKKNSGGVCAKRPVCLGAAAECSLAAACCSEVCSFFGLERCAFSTLGERCLTDDDCFNFSPTPPRCVGFVCQA